jgi:hypothetical protein
MIRLSQNHKSLVGSLAITSRLTPQLRYLLTFNPAETTHKPRTLQFYQMNLFECHEAMEADIIVLETNIESPLHYKLLHFLSRAKDGARLLTYNRLEDIYESVTRSIDSLSPANATRPEFHWKRLDINKSPVSKSDIL